LPDPLRVIGTPALVPGTWAGDGPGGGGGRTPISVLFVCTGNAIHGALPRRMELLAAGSVGPEDWEEVIDPGGVRWTSSWRAPGR
jgi:hypothetical protein